MGGMHVDHHQTLGILRQDVNAMQLGNGVAQWRHLASFDFGHRHGRGRRLTIQIGIGTGGGGQLPGFRTGDRRNRPAGGRLVQRHAGLPGEHAGIYAADGIHRTG